MDRFQAMQVFTRVVDANSFSRAADSLGLPRATVTTTIQNLEKLLQVRLLNRSTRRLSLTPDGASYYERCVRILADVEETEASLRHAASSPRGRLRVDVPGSIGRQVLLPRLCEFHHRYPDVELVIGMTDRPVDMVGDAVDCAIRKGELEDSSLVARRVGLVPCVTCASPEYLQRYGTPRSLDELAQHYAVNYFLANDKVCPWDFMVDGEPVEIKGRGVVSVNDADAYVTCGLQGFGLIQAPRYMVLPHLESGALREVLPQWQPAPMPISVVYLHNRHLSPKVRAFVDWVVELFSSCPLLSGCVVESECSFAKASAEGMRASGVQARELEGAF
ncbi:LysR family transcriptional regulator [Azoarcus sp. TTM-91]|uniref:LysR substrate-binding domain-containing protein n=1 Tax=Azoarcus sp. TTM-91 TaxID=2691581 RepID=UPI00145D8056|nr:LysR family transcriptional regulator [Azoarcus sp. TTM-91]NMG37491.1 LysR family transcriptional regulator [Azoarcus sp. TTM-91]